MKRAAATQAKQRLTMGRRRFNPYDPIFRFTVRALEFDRRFRHGFLTAAASPLLPGISGARIGISGEAGHLLHPTPPVLRMRACFLRSRAIPRCSSSSVSQSNNEARNGGHLSGLVAEAALKVVAITARLIPHRRSSRPKHITSVAMLNTIASNACSL
jgi:hypothetical protein